MAKSPHNQTSNNTSGNKPVPPAQPVAEYDANPSGIVIGLTVSMSWQLALVVLIPVFGGHLLDAHFNAHGAPFYTLAGLVIAIVGMILVVRKTLKELAKYMQASTGAKS